MTDTRPTYERDGARWWLPAEWVAAADLLRCATLLQSEHGENPEYDRALCELIGDAAGFGTDGAEVVAAILGVDRR